MTVAITGNDGAKYILDGRILQVGCYIENYVSEMIKFVKDRIKVEVFLFDRGFTSWEVISVLEKLQVPYIIFWKKQGEWYKEYLTKLREGEFKIIVCIKL